MKNPFKKQKKNDIPEPPEAPEEEPKSDVMDTAGDGKSDSDNIQISDVGLLAARVEENRLAALQRIAENQQRTVELLEEIAKTLKEMQGANE